MDVRTPITQALSDGTLTRAELKALMRRSDGPALRHLALWIVVVLATGALIAVSMGTLWVWPAMFLHGVVLVHHFSLQHECCHYTVFKTRWLNDAVGNICGVIIMLPNRHFRYEHCDHHTYTQLTGDDPEMIPLPKSIWGYLYYLSAVPYWRNKFTELFRHVAGRLTPEERRFIPKEEVATVIWEARLMLAAYLAIVAICWATGWWAPVWYWWLPVVLGEPVMRFIRMTEHVGKPTVRDMRENTRTNYVSWPMQFLSWNMNYHAEHHYASSVPFHALPKLHEKLRDVVAVEPRGYLGAHLDILAQLIGRKPRWTRPVARERVWRDLIAVSELYAGDATPVRLGERDLAVFDTVEGITVALARCTHGAANLCDGYFDGLRIECPLHQGLFDARSGAALAAPARVPLRMLPARVVAGRVQVLL